MDSEQSNISKFEGPQYLTARQKRRQLARTLPTVDPLSFKTEFQKLTKKQRQYRFTGFVRDGNIDMVKMLIENDIVDLKELDTCQSLLINHVNIWSRTDMIDLLIKKGIKLNAQTLARASANEAIESSFRILTELSQEELNAAKVESPNILEEVIIKCQEKLRHHQYDVFKFFQFFANDKSKKKPFSGLPNELMVLILLLYFKSYKNISTNNNADFSTEIIDKALYGDKSVKALVFSSGALAITEKTAETQEDQLVTQFQSLNISPKKRYTYKYSPHVK